MRKPGLRVSLDVYVATLLQNQALGGPQEVEEERLRRQRQAAADRIRKLREGVTLGPDLTIRDLINEGRRF